MSQKLIVIFAAALLSASLATHANPADTEETAVPVSAPAAAFNFFDPAYWSGAFAAQAQQPPISSEVTFNAARPSAWMQWADPSTHQQLHAAFANPATYTQFMRPDFYMEFTRPENLAAWMNPASYQVVMNPQTMYYWMQPASYLHAVDPAMYQQAMNPANYMVYLDPNTYSSLLQATSCDSENTEQTPTFFGFGC
jgi:hypothetical protein